MTAAAILYPVNMADLVNIADAACDLDGLKQFYVDQPDKMAELAARSAQLHDIVERAAGAQTDKQILEIALRKLALALDDLAAECTDDNGKPKAPSQRTLMRSRGVLPPYCSMALAKKVNAIELTGDA